MNDDDEAARLAAEIARIEAELAARQKLEAEIAAMEAAIAAAQAGGAPAPAPPPPPPPRPSLADHPPSSPSKKVTRLVRKGRAGPRRVEARVEETTTTTEDRDALYAQESRRKLNAECQQLERAMSRQRRASIEYQSHVVTRAAVPTIHHEQQREALEEEIRKMEAAIAANNNNNAAAAAERVQPMPASPKPPAMNPAAAAAAAAAKGFFVNKPAIQEVEASGTQKQKAPATKFVIDNNADAAPPPVAAHNNNNNMLLAALQGAVEERDKRVEAGEQIMQEFQPEVEAAAHATPQLSFAMAELVSKAARDREARLEAGGEKKMTTIKEKEEYKQEFNSIALEAAELGRLTRLNERIIEAVAVEKTPEQEWHSQGVLAHQWRANHMAIIHEAARLGAETKMKEKVVSSHEEENEDYDDWDEMDSPRMREIMALQQRAGYGNAKVDKLLENRQQDKRDAVSSMLVRPMASYNTVDEVILPKAQLPKVDPLKARKKLEKLQKLSEENHSRPLSDISNEVASLAWARRVRLDRPNILPKITEQCQCPYCVAPSPYQTFAYKVREGRGEMMTQRIRTREEVEREERNKKRIARRQQQQQQSRGGGASSTSVDTTTASSSSMEDGTSAHSGGGRRRVQRKGRKARGGGDAAAAAAPTTTSSLDDDDNDEFANQSSDDGGGGGESNLTTTSSDDDDDEEAAAAQQQPPQASGRVKRKRRPRGASNEQEPAVAAAAATTPELAPAPAAAGLPPRPSSMQPSKTTVTKTTTTTVVVPPPQQQQESPPTEEAGCKCVIM